MRLHASEREFFDWLLKLDDGRLTNDFGLKEDMVQILLLCVIRESIVEEIFGSGEEFDVDDLASKAILCPKNE